MPKESPSSNEQPAGALGIWFIWKFFRHYGLGFSHFSPDHNRFLKAVASRWPVW
jgi:hypothetical protein